MRATTWLASSFVELDARATPRGYRRLTIGGIRHYHKVRSDRTACGRPVTWQDGTAARYACATCNLGTERKRR